MAETPLDATGADGAGRTEPGTGASPPTGGSAGAHGGRSGTTENISDASAPGGEACACAPVAGDAEGTTRLRSFACGAKSPCYAHLETMLSWAPALPNPCGTSCM